MTFAFICVYLRPLLRGWRYHKYLESVTLAGSHAKGTDLRDSDFDIFLRLSPDTPGSLAAMQASLADRVLGHVRNVSVRIMLDGRFIDLVPGRGNILWQARYNTWLKTDFAAQIRYVRSSGLIDEILALKIWRRRHALRFPSFLMELATIHARPKDFRALLHFLATDFPTTRLLDPANSNNVVSDLLTEVEKLRISRTAAGW
ncbi:MAG TPA: nucleotidyltransferase domain-containing protein [Bryobacteraceae bacterium]|nr:nucleotidyltransferase domain-containing protein [Bryobacteraceae bacterium]